MNTATSIYLELFGVRKRLPDIEKISFSIDSQIGIERESSVSNSHRQIILYEFGHIIFYTWPDKGILTIEIYTKLPFHSALKSAIIEIFQPNQYTYLDSIRITGDSYV